MALKINDECISCNACISECPNSAIYEGGVTWALADGTHLHGTTTLLNGQSWDADERQAPLSNNVYYIVPSKCTECQGFHEEPQCAAVCPVDSCVSDDVYMETVSELIAKKVFLHG
ncbi:4Fe-4S dicluster protein [Chitinophaga skermanii]|uniref:4Fe-4S dicluster protein n=1 Tax=Chitinophaga skermanii TaxID=331697 RepID=A0A327QKQ3_9BACT|nr:4Fe-4S dicluster domain-containing protein [Chitinophaga skermanii]RAJ05236.1 4Fe-4S dicluster protein [Chitinophaga skermanii]